LPIANGDSENTATMALMSPPHHLINHSVMHMRPPGPTRRISNATKRQRRQKQQQTPMYITHSSAISSVLHLTVN